MSLRHLMCIALVAAVSPLAACNRADTRAQAEQTTADVKAAAEKAGDRITDGWLTTKIQAQYFADDDVKARYIDVSTHDRRVTLDGYVDSAVQRARAEQIARNTDGVASVDNRLKIGVTPQSATLERGREPVGTAGTSERSQPLDDSLITAKVQAQYFLDPLVKARTINVSTKNGVVTVRGEVDSEAERAQALTLARRTEGVTRVEDALSIKKR
jgi:osmotically-inducible protein OsmY